MKQVTMESVKQRIDDLESAGKVVGGLSLSSEFELACLRELVAVTEQVRLLTEQRDAVVVENVALKEIVSGVNSELYGKGFEVSGWHLNGAMEPLDNWFTDNGWGEPETPATDAAIAALRAEGIDQWIASRNGAWNGTTKQAEEFARQLRESKGASHE